MNTPERGLIESVELAEVMAYAEAPYRELARSAMNSSFERVVIENTAEKAGVAAAKSYIQKLGNEHLGKFAALLDSDDGSTLRESTENAAFTQSLNEFSDRKHPDSDN